MYRTLKKDAAGTASHACEQCGTVVTASDQGRTTRGCEHLVRTWRVAEDGRIRAEFTEPATSAV